MRTIPYRADIDGLRAVAILLVVLFHLFPGTATGGFIGVDVFFVISGYLITGIILESLSTNHFTIGNFYFRRIRRLFPSLLLVLVFCLVAGFLVLVPAEYFTLSKNMLGGLGFMANFTLWLDAGYFNVLQNGNMLLHLWSLGVEEQFYLVWPLLLIMLTRYAARLVIPVILILLLASFVLNLLLVNVMPDLTFYFPFTRFWEIGIGALLSAWQFFKPAPALPARVNDALSVLGLFLVLVASQLINNTAFYPGWWGLLPATGAALIIQAGPTAIVNRWFLSHPVVVWSGLISYPLYLWHWPLHVLFTISGSSWSPGLAGLATLSFSVLLAWLSYRFVELPIRQVRLGKTAGYCLSCATALAMAATLTLANDGWSARAPGGVELPTKIAALGAPGFGGDIAADWREGTCFLTTGQGPNAFAEDCLDDVENDNLVLLWGDSHAAALYPGLRALANEAGFGVGQFTTTSCPPVLDWNGPTNPLCEAINNQVINLIEDIMPGTVVLQAAWYRTEYDWQEIANTIARLKMAGVPNVVLLGAAPAWGDSVPFIIYQYYAEFNAIPARTTSYKLDTQVISAFDFRLQDIADRTGIAFVSLNAVFCDAGGCMLYLDDILNVTSLDAGHLSGQAAVYAIEEIAESFPGQQP